MFFQGQWQGEEQVISTIDPQQAVQLMREFDGFSGVAALPR